MASSEQGTGMQAEQHRIVSCFFDRYVIKVRLGPREEFIGIVEVGINKDFLSHRQRLSVRGTHDVSDLYPED